MCIRDRYIKADKTSNFYKTSKETHDILIEREVQKNHKLATEEEVSTANEHHKAIVRDFELEKKLVFKTSPRPAFPTIKDHKDDFPNNPKIRLLNPTKPEVGRISKILLEDICSKIKAKLKLDLFKNSNEVILWFNKYKTNPKRRNPKFVVYDIGDYYPSVTEQLMNDALDWATQHVEISADERNVIIKSKYAFLYHGDRAWTKRAGPFDNGQGFLDGAESTDLIGLFLLSKTQYLGMQMGKFRDDGLAISFLTPRETENATKKLCQIYQQYGLKLDVKINVAVVNYLDITLDLNTCLLYTSPSPRDATLSRMPSSA